MNRHILEKEVQEFIKANREKRPSEVALNRSLFTEVSSSEIAAQIDGWQRSVRKLPTWAFSDAIYYPNRVHLEQCSSEHTALIKQSLIEKNSRLVDLTGGFGVDSCYLAQEAKEVVHCEINAELSEIVKYNCTILGVNNLICKVTDGLRYLTQRPDHSLDYIYIDPSRRNQRGKVFLLDDCEPNITVHQELFFTKARGVITKLSPLLDISNVLSSLSQVKYVYVISLDNDCKELLVFQEKDFNGIPRIGAIRLFADQIQRFEFQYGEEKNTINRYSEPQRYLYDPDVALTKAGAFKTLGKYYGLNKLHQHTHLYTGTELIESFPGRIFQIDQVLPYADLKRSRPVDQANIATRNFPEKVVEIQKRHKIRDGGSIFLFFTTDCHQQLIVIIARRVKFN